jgi:hypothetical protein
MTEEQMPTPAPASSSVGCENAGSALPSVKGVTATAASSIEAPS